MVKSLGISIQLRRIFCQKFQLAHYECVKSLKEDQLPQNSNSVLEDTFELEHIENVDIRIFYDEAINKQENKLVIGFIAFERQNTILAQVSKQFFGGYPLVAKVLAIKKALELALQKNWRKAVFYSDFKLVIELITNTQSSAPVGNLCSRSQERTICSYKVYGYKKNLQLLST